MVVGGGGGGGESCRCHCEVAAVKLAQLTAKKAVSHHAAAMSVLIGRDTRPTTYCGGAGWGVGERSFGVEMLLVGSHQSWATCEGPACQPQNATCARGRRDRIRSKKSQGCKSRWHDMCIHVRVSEDLLSQTLLGRAGRLTAGQTSGARNTRESTSIAICSPRQNSR